MIKNIVILECDACGIEFEHDETMGPDEVIRWARTHGWWAEYHSIRQYCPGCKMHAKLAMTTGATP